MEDAVISDVVMSESALIDANIENIDDLFGEAADGLPTDGLGIALPAAPLPPGLVLRIIELQTRGCCTKLAWSNTGSIAQITDQGRKIVFRTLIRDGHTGVWLLSAESKQHIVAPEVTTWQHIQFNGMGIDLAVADSHGQVHVYHHLGALGKMHLAPNRTSSIEIPCNDLDAVVGMHWLPVSPADFSIPYISPATKLAGRWTTNLRHRDPSEPKVHNAADGKQALLYVSHDAKLTLMYQIENLWQSTSVRLESITSPHELLSHAAIGEEAAHLLLVTHDLAKCFRVYKITITWNASQQTRPNGPPFTTVSPTLGIGHLTILENVAPQHADTALLSDLHLIPTVPDLAADPTLPTYPTILGIFTRALLPADPTQQHQEAFSVLARWHVESVTPTLHKSFAKLKSNVTPSIQHSVTILRRQEDLMTPRLVLSMASQGLNTMLAFSASDGTIEFRDRATMTSIEPYGDPAAASSLTQVGFEHLLGEHNIEFAMSPDGSGLVGAKSDGTLTYKGMALRYSWQPLEDGISDTRDIIEAAVVGIARQYSSLCFSQHSSDEVLALLPPGLSSDMRTLFIQEVIKMTNRPIDIALQDINRQHKTAITDSLVSRAMSAQLVVGTNQGTGERDFAGKLAFAFLHLKLACLILANLGRAEALGRPDTYVSVRGQIRWGSDLLVWIVEGLTSVARRLKTKQHASAQEAFAGYIRDTDNPVFHLLINSFGRTYIRYIVSTIPKYLTGLQHKILPAARSVLERQQLEEIVQRGTSLPFKYSAFEAFMTSIDIAVREAYSSSNVRASRRTEIELELLTDPAMPDELHSVLQHIIGTSLPPLMEGLDGSALYFRDTSWLGIESLAGGRQYDAITKLPITKGAKLRVCRRCGAVMVDIPQEKFRELPSWFAFVQRNCVCGNYWVSE